MFISSPLQLIYCRPLCITLFISLMCNDHFKLEHVLNQIQYFPLCLLITYSFSSFWQLQSSDCSNVTIYYVLFSSLLLMTQYGFHKKYYFGLYLKRSSRIRLLSTTRSLYSGPCEHSFSSGSLQ